MITEIPKTRGSLCRRVNAKDSEEGCEGVFQLGAENSAAKVERVRGEWGELVSNTEVTLRKFNFT